MRGLLFGFTRQGSFSVPPHPSLHPLEDGLLWSGGVCPRMEGAPILEMPSLDA